ncbi:MAG: dihydropteroate synthase [Deltaproteobacteria bacterium]|nr:dihydropteroate synthase [Deltaproteobacteria bacterium]
MASCLTIPESINIMSKTIGPAIKERDPKPIQKMAREQQEAGGNIQDLNLGPARKAGDEMMAWLVKTVEEVSDLPLALDTTNTVAIEAGLKASKTPERCIINSISAQPASLEDRMPLVKKYGCSFVALTLSEEGIPRDVNERGMCAAEIYGKALEYDIPTDRMYIDPIVLPICVDPGQVASFQEFLPLIPDFAPGAKSTCGLSNISNGTPTELRHFLNRAYQAMLINLGIYSSIVDAYDSEMMALCQGKIPQVEELTVNLMNGVDVDANSLRPELQVYYRSIKCLMGDVLYSHSWIEDLVEKLDKNWYK